MGTAPPKNLPPESIPYINWLEQQVLALQQAAGISTQNQSNTNKAQVGTTQTLAGQVASIATALTQLAQVTSNQVSPATASNATSGFILNTTRQALTSLTFTVPIGYTRAAVTAMGAVSAASGATGGDRLFANVNFTGSVGVEMGTVLPASVPMGILSCSNGVILTGLTGGGTFVVDVGARLQTGPGTSVIANAQLSASVLFLK